MTEIFVGRAVRSRLAKRKHWTFQSCRESSAIYSPQSLEYSGTGNENETESLEPEQSESRTQSNIQNEMSHQDIKLI